MLGETPVHVGAESPTQSLPSLLCFFFFFSVVDFGNTISTVTPESHNKRRAKREEKNRYG